MQTNRLPLTKFGGLGIFSPMTKAISPAPAQSAALERRETGATRTRADASPCWYGPFERIAHRLRTRQRGDLDACPAGAADACDVAPRIRALDRNVPHPYY
jgi:hypothetical protein